MIAEGLHGGPGAAARMCAMLSEEALIVLAAFGACALLILGILELVWPTRPKHPAHRPPPVLPRAARPHRQSALTRHARERTRPYARPQLDPAAPPEPALAADAPVELVAESPPVHVVAGSPPETLAASPAAVAADVPREPLAELPPANPAPPPRELIAASPPPVVADAPRVRVRTSPPAITPKPMVSEGAKDEPVVEVCFALYQARRHAEVIERAAAALTAGPDGRPPMSPQETAALWSVVALARQALGEDPEARVALEHAIAVAPEGDRPTYQRQLASLAESVAQGLLAEAERQAGPASEERLATIRSAAAWLERGMVAAPGDAALAELAASAQAMLWPAWERTVMVLAQRQEFRTARRLLREALADPRFPAWRTETFKELFSGTFSGEIGQLTAQAIRSMQEARESDALASLQRAETLLDTLNAQTLQPSRREEVDRRLWWGYNKLGARRVEAAEYETALEPLFHALSYDVGPARRQETVALLVRALDGVAEARALSIRERADAGDREAALVQCDKLWALLRSATDMGLTHAELKASLARVQRLFESLGRKA